MSFSLNEILNSVFSAAIFGILFSLFWTPIAAIFKTAFFSALGVVLFSFGFMLLSYICLDGMIRAYMFFCSFLFYILSKKYLFDKIIRKVKKTLNRILNIAWFKRRKLSHALDKTEEK